MSIHPCEWASQKGCELKLSCPERVTLWQLARRAATKGFCWPSVVQLMFDTGLARQSVVTVVRRLADLKLIRIEKDGQKNVYHIETGNRSRSGPVDDAKPVQKKTTNRSKIRPANGSEPVQNETGTGLNLDRNRSKSTSKTGLNLDPNLKENIKTNHARAREAAASDREPENKILKFGKQEEGAQPPPQETPDDGSPFIGLDEAKAWMGKTLGRAVHAAMPAPEVVTEDDPPRTPEDEARMAAQLAALAHELGQSKRRFAIPPGPQFTRWEQLDVMASKRQWKQPTPEQLQAMYRAQGLHRGAPP